MTFVPRRSAFLCLAMAISMGCGGTDEDEQTTGSDQVAPAIQVQPSGGGGAELNASEQVQLLSRTLASELPPEMRLFAAQQLVVLGTPDTVAPLTDAIADPDTEVSLVAINGVPKTDSPETIAALKERAENGSPRVERAAKKRLGEFL